MSVPFAIPPSGSPRPGATTPTTSSVAPGQSLIALEVEACDECGWNYAVNLLWPVLGRGLFCGPCIEELRDQERSA